MYTPSREAGRPYPHSDGREVWVAVGAVQMGALGELPTHMGTGYAEVDISSATGIWAPSLRMFASCTHEN